MKKYLSILILSLLVFSCGEKPEDMIIGSWKFNFTESKLNRVIDPLLIDVLDMIIVLKLHQIIHC